MGDVVFFTGFPGFIGKRIASKLLDDPATDEVWFVVQKRFEDAAKAALDRFPEAQRKKARLVEGDITQPFCGLSDAARKELREKLTHAYHLAAAYNLALDRDVGMKVNVEGTKHVLDLVEGAPRFKKFVHFSTCAISGSHTGVFRETDFDVGQKFKNFYEETKFLSEKEVRARWDKIPTVIFRPGVVVGDSKTGEAEKIDGPYYAYIMISRGLHKIAARSTALFNVVPVDYVADAMHALVKKSNGATKQVFALSDPAPLTFDQFFDVSAAAFDKKGPSLRLPAFLFKPLFKFPGIARVTGIPKQSFDYSVYPVQWTCDETQKALEGTGVKCPPYYQYAPALVRYFREHLEATLPKAGKW